MERCQLGVDRRDECSHSIVDGNLVRSCADFAPAAVLRGDSVNVDSDQLQAQLHVRYWSLEGKVGIVEAHSGSQFSDVGSRVVREEVHG